MFGPKPRTGMPPVKLPREEFGRRFRLQFQGDAYAALGAELSRLEEAAWASYDAGDKAPRKRPAGPGHADPSYELSEEWIEARAAIDAARARHEDPAGPPRILLVNASPRSDHTCPGEVSKSWRLSEMARETLEGGGARVETIDLSRTASEYGRHIHPCKGCFSTAAALCHWPCSCYPNHGLGQSQDWMNDLYPLWVEAHGVMIVTPVHWYAPTTPLKAMIDRLVCADGGNPDPTSTQGKDAAKAKDLELKGWPYPRHLKDRLFALVVHGDVEGARGVKSALSDWLRFMELRPAGNMAELDRYIGYWEPYATSHDALDRDEGIQGETRNAARTLLAAVAAWRAGLLTPPDASLAPARNK